MEKLLNHLELHLPRIKSRVPNINSGGCGIFTFSLKEALNSLGIRSSIHIITSSDIEAFNQNIQEDEMLAMDLMGWTHIILKVGDYLIDSDGVYEGLDDCEKFIGWNYKLSCEISIDYLEDMIDNLRWNKMFDRKYRTLINDMINEMVEDYLYITEDIV